METQRIWSQPHPMASPSICGQESYGCIGGQGSPTPAETASPKSASLQSPSLPASGRTEFQGVDSMTWDVPSDQPQELLAGRDPQQRMAGAPQKQYVGVRVKMPVRELLKKMRLSKASDAGKPTDASVQADTAGPSRRTGRKRAHIEKRPKQNRQKTCTALRSMEELDILVEVLQKDLCESHCSPESRVPTLNLPGAFPELPLPWWEASPQPDGEQMEGSWDSPKLQPWDSFPNSDPPRHTNPKKGHGSGCQTAPQPTKTLLSSCVGGGHWPRGHAVVPTFGEVTPRAHDSTEHVAPASKLEGDATDLQGSREWLKPSTGRSAGQDTSVVSFFQFQLHQEESWLGDLTMDKLLVPNKNGDSLLHEAVAQGRRALSYALSWRFALLDRIDEKSGASQTALHIAVQKNHHLIASDLLSLGADVNARDDLQKTALHLCAEKGYLRVLEVLRNYQERGTHLEVDAIDHQGFTPLQRAACVHSALVMSLENGNLTPEAQKLLILRKDKILSSIGCLLQMGANPWVQGAKSSIQASVFLEKVQKNHELLFFLQTHRPIWQEDSGVLPDPNGMDLPYLQREDLDPPLVLRSDIFDSFSGGNFPGSIDPFPKGTL